MRQSMRRSPEGPRPASQGGRKLLYRTSPTLDHDEKPIGPSLEIQVLIVVGIVNGILGEALLYRTGQSLHLQFRRGQ